MNFTINDVVKNDLCIGCGICTTESETSSMEWNNDGFLVPKLDNSFNEKAIKLCPFNPRPDEAVRDEVKLAAIFLNESSKIDNQIGRFENTYVGYSKEYRETSSSGGIATYVFEQLLKQKLVDNLFIVKEINGTYEYQWFNDFNQIKLISKTRYIPVTLEKLFKEIDTKKGKVAVSGVACFVKAIRLKQYYYPKYNEKIPFLIGIICGGLKSKFFTDYLAQKAGVKSNYSKQDYRIKNPKSQAIDYSFGVYDENQEFKQVRMKTIGDMWGTGMFKSNACDFCEDVTTELADISLGDAWIHPYTNDGLGNSVVVTRTSLADKLIKTGIEKGKLNLDSLSLVSFLNSQSGSFNHRHKGLAFRIRFFKNKKNIPPKRFVNEKSSFDFKIVQYFRLLTRKNSLEIWKKTKKANEFDKKIKHSLFMLKNATRIYHYKKIVLEKLKV